MLTLPGSAAATAGAAAGLTVIAEAFADRAYTADGKLVPRGQPGAVLSNPAYVAARAVAMVTSGAIEAAGGQTVRLDPRSICIHGDTAGAVALARAVRRALEETGTLLVPFA